MEKNRSELYDLTYNFERLVRRSKLFMPIIFIMLSICIVHSKNYKDSDSLILNLDFDGSDFSLYKNFNFEDNGFKGIRFSYGVIPRIRFEGESLTPTERVSVVPSNLPDGGNAIQYTLGPQKETDSKARIEHYLFVGDFKKTYVSEFSMKLHPGFTPVDVTRFDGGSAWCCLRQWHQSSPESPPISLSIKRGTNNVIFTQLLSGAYKKGPNNKTFTTTEKTIQLDKWYHFRYEWHIDPGTDNSYCKIWMSDKRRGDELTEEDVWCDYKGRIGYSLEGKPESEIEPLSRNIREQQGIYQNTYIDPKSFHAVVYDNVRIYLKK